MTTSAIMLLTQPGWLAWVVLCLSVLGLLTLLLCAALIIASTISCWPERTAEEEEEP
jgi:uncharacterized membrane protein